MKILIVCSGNSGQASTIVKNQADSIVKFDNTIQIEFFLIKGKGMFGYLKNIFDLRKFLKCHKYDVIHAHYSLSAFVASLANAKPLVVSLMGSDIRLGNFFLLLIRLFVKIFKWKDIIVKSEDMKNLVRINNVNVIPNGVDLNVFKPLEKINCLKYLGWDESKKHILFAANPNRPEKNFQLANEAFSVLKMNVIELHVLENVSNNRIPYYLNASDVILLTSLWEGSPNVIKEAMACNCIIVATDVGDISWLLEDTKGCYLCKHDINDIADKLSMAINFTNPQEDIIRRNRLIELNLSSDIVASKIIDIYKQLV